MTNTKPISSRTIRGAVSLVEDEEGASATVTGLGVPATDVKSESVIDDSQKKVAEPAAPTATLSELFSTAEPFDYFLMFTGVIGGLISGISLPFFNVLFGEMLDALNSDPDSFSEGIGRISLAFVGVACVNLWSGWAQVACWSITGERQTQKLRDKYIKAILSQEIGWFDTCGASELSTKVAELTGKVQDGTGRKIGDLIQYFGQFAGSFVVGLYLCWELTVVLLSAFPVIAGAGAFMIVAITSFANASLDQYAKAGGLATESLSSIRTVTALNCQPDIIKRYRLFLLEAMHVGIVKGFKVGLGNGMVFGACFCTYALGFWYGGKLIADALDDGCNPYLGDDCITGGTIMAVFFSVIMGSIALGQLAPPLSAFTAAKAAVYPMMQVIKRTPLIDGFSEDGVIPSTEEKTKGSIELSSVQFAYPSRPHIQVCKGYNLSINPGETVALVGPSGCGKSTIINLLLRFYDPQDGSIKLDGRDIKDLNVRWLRSQMGYVGQEPVLFSGSIADNIAYGIDKELLAKTGAASSTSATSLLLSPEALRERVIEAAKQSNAHDFITGFTQGYDTDVGSGGVGLSGGQKQRIAIARALIRRPAVLLLDEATSALDASSERMVQQSIDALQQSKSQTTIVIAHRLSTIRNADKIAVVDKGQIVELGTHDELLELNGLYADLIRLQLTTGSDSDGSIVKTSSSASLTGIAAVSSSNNLAAEDSENKDVVKGEVVKKAASGSAEKDQLDKTASKDEKTNQAVANAEPELSKEESSKVWKQMWSLILRHPLWLLAGLLGASTFGAVFPVWGLVLAKTQHMFYYTTSERIRNKATELAGYYLSLASVALVSSIFQFWGVAQVGERISLRLRSEMFESIMRREIEYFDYEENNTGALTTRLSDDSRLVHKAGGESLAKQLQALFTLSVGLGIGLSASWKIALVVLATFPINIAASAVQMQAVAGQQYDNNDDGAAAQNGIIASAFNHMRTVSAFSMQFHVAKEYSTVTTAIMEKRCNRAHIAGLGFGGSNFALFMTYALLFWYGSTLIQNDEVSFEEMMTSILSLMLGALGLGQAMSDIGDQKAGIRAASRIFQAIEAGKASPIDGLSTTGIKPTREGEQISRSQGRIELKGLNFRYPTRKDMDVCHDYNLTIEAGEVVALVGPSGSGKSTIMNLLLRFYDPLEGQILLDGVDIKSLNVRWLRSQIGYVGQEPKLFSGSVAENVLRGLSDESAPVLTLDEAMQISDGAKNAQIKQQLVSFATCGQSASKTSPVYEPAKTSDVSVGGDIELGSNQASLKSSTVSDEELHKVIDACKLSNAHDFISSFTQGYDTDVGEGSIMVSGGQKQRIAIARALIRRPAVLLLDEATSALDASSERMVQQSIDALQQSKSQTTIVIAHRLSTIRNADKIAVVDKGHVVELGTHDELLELNGLYSQLWEKQGGAANDAASSTGMRSAFQSSESLTGAAAAVEASAD